nr:cell death abnormality protein 1 [Crassostrea gigas]
MIHQPWIIVLCYLNIFPGACQTASDKGYCNLPNSFSIDCCTGFYLSENKCKECEPGFIGKNCSLTCQIGYFGLQCKELCNCSPDNYCDPRRGCVCNTTSVNCTDPAAADSIATLKVVPLLITAITCLVLGTICIRMRYSEMMKRKKDLFSMQNVANFTVRNHPSETEEENPHEDIYDHVNLKVQYSNHSICNTGDTAGSGDSSLGLTSAVLLQQYQSVKGIQNKWRLHDEQFGESTVDEPDVETVDNKTTDREADIYSTPCKFMTTKPIHRYSEQRQQRNNNEPVTFEYPNSMIDAIVHDPESRTKPISPLKWTQDEEIYTNNDILAHTNNSLRQNSPMESDESE